MKPLLFLANSFINTFGITHPTPEAEERTAKILATMIGLVILTVAGAGVAALYLITRH